MKASSLYLVLCVAGAALPCRELLPFVREHGLAPRLLFERRLLRERRLQEHATT